MSTDSCVTVSGIPDGTCRLRAYTNGLPVWQAKGDAIIENSVKVAIDDLVPAACRGASALDKIALLSMTAYDAANQEIARCKLDCCSLATTGDATRMSASSVPNGDGNRLVASTLHHMARHLPVCIVHTRRCLQTGDSHAWRFHVADAINNLAPKKDTGSSVMLVHLRAMFDVDPGILGENQQGGEEEDKDDALATICWSHAIENERGTVAPDSRKRRRGPTEPWGEVTSVTHLRSGCSESVFVLTLAKGDPAEGIVRCTVEWNQNAKCDRQPPGGLRYAVYACTGAPWKKNVCVCFMPP